jgi:hypothetical protein
VFSYLALPSVFSLMLVGGCTGSTTVERGQVEAACDLRGGHPALTQAHDQGLPARGDPRPRTARSPRAIEHLGDTFGGVPGTVRTLTPAASAAWVAGQPSSRTRRTIRARL